METEKLIPLSEVKKKITAVRQYFSGYPSTEQDKLARSVAKLCMEEVGKIKPVDAVEVVRCKDCKQWGGVVYGGRCKQWSAPLSGMTYYTSADDFCSYGERRTDGEVD
jgi:hypothetical protein